MDPKTFADSERIAVQGGRTAKRTRQDIEEQIGESVISPVNAKTKDLLEVDIRRIDGRGNEE